MVAGLRRNVMRAALLLSLSTAALAAPAAAAPLTFVYKGAGCDGRSAVGQFETAIGRKVDGVSDFLDWTSTWSNVLVSVGWSTRCWAGSGYKLNLAVPLVVAVHGSSPMHDLASGKNNTYFTQIATTLVKAGFGDAYIRLGEEFNYNFYPWAASSSPTLWIQGYRQAQASMKAVPGAHFHFVWNPALWTGNVAPDKAYPGDDVVDVVGPDTYDQSWLVNYTDPHVRWDQALNSTWGLADMVAFAKKHNKPYGFPEWGVGTRSDGHGGGDDAYFIANVAPFIKGAEYASYWDFAAPDFNGLLSGGGKPGALAAFMGEFGTTTAGSKSSVQVEKTLGKIMSAHAAPFSAEKAPVVTCSGCQVGVLQNAPGHWMLVAWSTTASPTASIGWNFTPATANVYDPSVGASAVQSLGKSTSVKIALKANTPLIVALQR